MLEPKVSIGCIRRLRRRAFYWFSGVVFAIDWHDRANSMRGRRGIDIPEIRRGFDFEVELRETGNGCLVPIADIRCTMKCLTDFRVT